MSKNIFKLAKQIKGEINKGIDDYHTGLIGEQIIVASYQTMPLDKLEKLRFILNKIIKKKKIALKVMQHNKQIEQEIKQENDYTLGDRHAG